MYTKRGAQKQFYLLSCFMQYTFILAHRYASRCLMIEFANPPVGMTIAEYMQLVELWTACSTCIGFCISLGKRFFNEGVEEVDSNILPSIASSASEEISPRVIPSYAILFWFALQVSCSLILFTYTAVEICTSLLPVLNKF